MITGTDIQIITSREHEHLINLNDELIAAVNKLPDDVE